MDHRQKNVPEHYYRYITTGRHGDRLYVVRMGERFAGGSDVFKGSTEVGTEKIVILKHSTMVGDGKMVILEPSTMVDDGKMTVGKASSAVFCGIWLYFRFPPRWSAKYGRFSCFHCGFLPKMTVGGISTVVVGKI